MPLSPPVDSPETPTVGVREVRRRETRARIFETALAEIAQRGLAAADVSAIAAAAGVVRGTFYFHFPTKEHVLVELERNEETKIVAELDRVNGDLTAMLTQLVHGVLAAQHRLGTVVFRDMLGLHFSSTRPVEDALPEHPLAEFLAAAIEQAKRSRQVAKDANAAELATFFLTGLFALLSTGADMPEVLEHYVTTMVKGMETR
jgi:AcrR family transcriptional regulator